MEIKTKVREASIQEIKYGMYSNPASDYITIEPETHILVYIEIKDIKGKTMLRQKIKNSAKQKIDVSQLINGIYFVNIIDKVGKIRYKSGKFIKQ